MLCPALTMTSKMAMDMTSWLHATRTALRGQSYITRAKVSQDSLGLILHPDTMTMAVFSFRRLNMLLFAKDL